MPVALTYLLTDLLSRQGVAHRAGRWLDPLPRARGGKDSRSKLVVGRGRDHRGLYLLHDSTQLVIVLRIVGRGRDHRGPPAARWHLRAQDGAARRRPLQRGRGAYRSGHQAHCQPRERVIGAMIRTWRFHARRLFQLALVLDRKPHLQRHHQQVGLSCAERLLVLGVWGLVLLYVTLELLRDEQQLDPGSVVLTRPALPCLCGRCCTASSTLAGRAHGPGRGVGGAKLEVGSVWSVSEGVITSHRTE